MKFKNLILILSVLISSKVFGQGLPEASLCSPVLFKIDKERGSGFFLSDSNLIYFVTARHCLFDTVFSLSGDSGKFIFYPHNIVKDNPSVMSIDLKSAFSNNFIKYDKNHDVAVIRIGEKIKKDKYFFIVYLPFVNRNSSTNIYVLPSTECLKYHETNIGDEIFLFGYPSSIGVEETPQFDYNRPLLRKGIIAGKYEKSKTIILDCPVYFGNSGSPVFEMLTNYIFNNYSQPSAKLIGICSQYIPYVDQSGGENSQTMNSGYSVIVPIDYALELMKKFR